MSNKVLVIAEVGSVHDGSLGNAQNLIQVGAEAGVNAVKFQTHIAEAETLRNAPMPPYFKGEPRFDYFQRTGFSREKWQQLKDTCEQSGVEFMSSPFSIEAVELLNSIGMARYKMPSGEVTNLPLLDVIAQTGKPVILSSGMSSWLELDAAVNTILRHHSYLAVLQCTSEYPCPYRGSGPECDARDENALRGAGRAVRSHDHALCLTGGGNARRTVIEKHLTFSRKMYGSDAKHSLEPGEFADLVQGIRAIETMLTAKVDKDARVSDLREMKNIFEKSVVTVVPIPAGTVITASMVAVKKPGTGIPARRLGEVIGQRVTRDIPQDTLLREEDLHA